MGIGMMSVEVGVDKQEEHKGTRSKRRGEQKESKKELLKLKQMNKQNSKHKQSKH
jgi:hypothetical protein